MDQSEHHRLACLRRCRLVFPPARLAFMPPLLGVYVFTDRLAFAAADWCFRLHGWPIMPPLLGVYVFTDRPPRPPPTGASACTAGLLCRRCWASTSSPTGLPSPLPTGVSACTAGLYAAIVGRLRLHRPACLRRRRLVFPPARLAFMPPLLGVYVFTDRLAFAAADWCFRLHGWPLCRRCWASTSSPTGLPPPPPTGVSACTAGLYAAVVGRLRLHRPACLRRRRLVFPPARLAFMPPLLGVYVFTDRPPRPPPTGASAGTAGLYAAVVGRLRLHRPACLRRRRLVFPPARLAFMPPLLGVYVFTDRLAFAAADWCFRLHGWPLCRRCWASTSSPTGLPSPPPTGVSACTAGLYAAVVGRLRLHRPACLRRRRLVSSPARLAYYAAVVGRLRLHRPACLCRRRPMSSPARLAFMPPLLGVYVFTDRLAFAAADWCFRLHGWPLCRRCWASTSSPTGHRIRR
uniref:cysteine dioxygenase n=1 Tax=Oryza rufipogon TaxID=4529 RepID=U6E846_ORYRU|nr:ORW1943Ba0047B01.7 [Oryza rufipogon]